jgi:hypothetical protein
MQWTHCLHQIDNQNPLSFYNQITIIFCDFVWTHQLSFFFWNLSTLIPLNSYNCVFELAIKSRAIMISLLQTGDNSPKGGETIGVAFRWQTFCFSSWWRKALNPANHDCSATLECMQLPLDLWTHKSTQTSKYWTFLPLSEDSAKACSPKLTFTTWLIMSWTLQIAKVWSTFPKGYIHKIIEFPKLS